MGKLTVNMPDIGEGVVEGEVIEWLKKVGDLLLQDEPVVVVMTDKATVELPAPRPGRLSKHYFAPGQIAVKDKPLYEIELDSASDVSQEGEEDSPSPLPLAKAKSLCAAATCPKATAHKGLATPPVRHLAKLLGIDLSSIQGSGKGGRITIDDLKGTQRAIPERSSFAAQQDDEERPLLGIKRLMAEKMKSSNDHIPHFSYFEKVDATRLVLLREKVNRQASEEGVHVTYMPFFIRAISFCIKKYPEMNSSLDEAENKLIIHHHQNIGVAVAGPQGLVVAVIKDVQEMPLDQLIRSYEDLKKRATAGLLKAHETKGSTFTISNFGVLGGAGLWATPVINYPEAAIVAVDRIQKQPMVINNQVVVRDVLNVSWSFDHRFIDGEMAAAISRDFCALMQNPAPLLSSNKPAR